MESDNLILRKLGDCEKEGSKKINKKNLPGQKWQFIFTRTFFWAGVHVNAKLAPIQNRHI